MILRPLGSILTLLLGAHFWPIGEAVAEKDNQSGAHVQFINGDKILGTILDSDTQHKLKIQSSHLKTTTSLRLENVRRIKFPESTLVQKPSTLITLIPRFRMREGDKIRGNLVSITDKHVLLDTKFAGILKIDRAYAHRGEHLRQGKGLYRGPNSAKEWSILPVGSWAYSQGVFSSRDSGQIGRGLALTEKSHLSFRVKYETAFRFKLRLYADDINDKTPGACYELNLNRSYAYLQTRGKARAKAKPVGIQGARWRQITMDQNSTSHLLDVFTDRKTGTITLFINNKQTCTLKSQSPNPLGLGKGVTFIAEERYPVNISNILVQPWDGVVPQKQHREKPDAKLSTPVLTDQKGNSTPFSKLRIKGENTEVISAEASRVMPTKSWQTIQFPPHAQEPKKYKDDVQLHLHDGTKLIVRMDTVKEGKLRGYHQALGEIAVELSAIEQMDFNIYAN
ncbi:MAG: hypothetical protein AB8F34_00185 [Akkermansiaceae bacterium]